MISKIRDGLCMDIVTTATIKEMLRGCLEGESYIESLFFTARNRYNSKGVSVNTEKHKK
jgi:hypothetical protein